MGNSLQEKLVSLPIHAYELFAPIPREDLFYHHVSYQIEEFKEPTLLIINCHSDLIDFYIQTTTETLLQDPNLIAIVICLKNTELQEELFVSFRECFVPIIKIEEDAFIEIFLPDNQSENPYPLSYELEEVKKRGIINIAGNLSTFLSVPLLFLDSYNKLLWQIGELKDITIILEMMKQNQYKLMDKPYLIYKDKYQVFPIYINENTRISLITYSNLKDWHLKIINKLVDLFGLVLQTESIIADGFLKLKDHFVSLLLNNKFESQTMLIEQVKFLGWNLEKAHHLILISPKLKIKILDPIDIIPEIIVDIENYISKKNENMIVFSYHNQIVILIEDNEERSNIERKRFVMEKASEMETYVENIWKEYFLYIGIGKWYSNIRELSKSFLEAKMALQYGEKWIENKGIFHIEDLGLITLLNYINNDVLNDYRENYLSLLIENDKTFGTEYIKTLKAYIQHQCNMNNTSQYLFIHINTLRKRLKKIQEISGINLQDNEEITNLIVALKINSFLNE